MDLTDHPGRTEPPGDAAAQPAPRPLSSTPPPTIRAIPASNRFKDRPPAWIDLFDPRQPEAFLAFCSAWASLQMWLWPGEFEAANGLVMRKIGLYGHETTWAIFGAIAALFKVAGLISRMSPRWSGFAAGLRASGLFMSIIFWLIVGISSMVDLPHSILPVALTGLGMAAAFELAERRDPRETWR